MSRPVRVAVIGGGIVGLAVAMKLVGKHPAKGIVVLEKEGKVAVHQTGHNSGVIHSGIYYRPGSFKAHMCVSGARELVRFCRENGIEHEMCGKVVIAVHPGEIPALRELHRRGNANGVPGMKLLSPHQLGDYEPHSRCVEGLQVPTTGIVDFGQVAQTCADIFQAAGGHLRVNCRVTAIQAREGSIEIDTSQGGISAGALINCGGLHSDRLARMAGLSPPCRIVPFRGEYYSIRPSRTHLVRGLIYPVPDPRFPFLGVHFTRRIDGKVEAGPNAVLATAREGYRKRDLSIPDLVETLRYQGFRHLALRYWRPALHEVVRSFSRNRFAAALQQLVPEIESRDLVPGGAGVRAQALGRDGAMLDDFVILKANRMVHVLNAPSPAATSAFSIAEYILREASPML